MKQRFPNGVSFDTLEDLKGYKIGYIRGGGLTPLFQKANIEPDWVTDLAQNAKKLFLGRIDMHAATELAGWGIIQKLYPENVNAIAMTEKPIHTIDGHIIFSKNQHALKQQFERGFKIIQKNGTYLKVLKRYYGERQIPEKAIKLIEETTTIY